MARGIGRSGGYLPESQATPIKKEEVEALVDKYKPSEPLVALTIWLMWKTASRFSDVARLKRANFLEVTPSEIIIQFGVMKANQTGIAKATSLVQIKDRMVTSHYFSLVEQKKAGRRRRPIQWAKRFNERMKRLGYKADVNLHHHSKYFIRVLQACGATYDMKAGFFQLKLPNNNTFTFADEEGNVYGLTRLPMGISTARNHADYHVCFGRRPDQSLAGTQAPRPCRCLDRQRAVQRLQGAR